MKTEAFADADAVARAAAEFIAAQARAAVLARGRFTLAISGGRTPWIMLRELASEALPWERIAVVQVDERIAPAGHPDRNFTQLQLCLLLRAPLRPAQVHAMPVEDPDLAAAARRYVGNLRDIAGTPPVLDLVHLGLGADGHTASLVPGDPILDVIDADVALTGVYGGLPRMSLTYPMLNRCRRILWVVTGADKSQMLARLLDGDASIPAARVRRDHAVVYADRAAAGPRAGP